MLKHSFSNSELLLLLDLAHEWGNQHEDKTSLKRLQETRICKTLGKKHEHQDKITIFSAKPVNVLQSHRIVTYGGVFSTGQKRKPLHLLRFTKFQNRWTLVSRANQLPYPHPQKSRLVKKAPAWHWKVIQFSFWPLNKCWVIFLTI